jgi:type II secretory pathway pseudopilin PulG
VIAAIAIPAMSGIFGKAETQKVNRNAQNIVAAFNAARAAGNSASHTETTAIAAVTASPGLNGAGTFATANFAAIMSDTERDAADAKISAVGSGADLTLVYNP